MDGTAWTGNGEGATAQELYDAAKTVDAIGNQAETQDRARKNVGQMKWESRTNLRLTGEPLNFYDLRRIEECEL